MTDTYRVHCECEKCDIHFSFETENYQLSEEAGGPDLEVYCPLCTQPAIVVDKEDIPYEDDNPQCDGNKDRAEARNVITVYDDGSMVAEKCVPEAM